MDPADDKGGKGGTGTDDQPRRHPAKKRDALVTSLTQTYGSVHNALSVLANRQLDHEEEVEALRAKLPKDGAVVLSTEDAAKWAAYRTLGEPAALEATATKARDLEAKEAQRTRDDRHRDFGAKAEVSGDVLAKMATREGFDVAEVREEERDGTKAKVLYVRPAGDATAAPVALAAFAESKGFTEFLPALTAGGGTQQGQQGSQDRTAGRAAGGAQYPHQSAGGSGAGAKDPVGAFLERREQARQSRPSPLAPPGAPAVKAT